MRVTTQVQDQPGSSEDNLWKKRGPRNAENPEFMRQTMFQFWAQKNPPERVPEGLLGIGDQHVE